MKARGYCQRLKVDLGVWKFLHKATSRFCSQCQLGFQRNTSKKRYLQMAKKWLNTGCSYLKYTFHLGMFRKSSAAPTRKDIGAGGTVWTDIATHVFNYTKYLYKSSMIKRIWLQPTFSPVFLQNVNSLLTSPTATAWCRRITLVFAPLDFRNWWKSFSRIWIIMGKLGCTRIRASSSCSSEAPKRRNIFAICFVEFGQHAKTNLWSGHKDSSLHLNTP